MRVFLLAVCGLALLVPATVHAQPGPGSPDTIASFRASDGEIVLVWTPVPAATGYVVYRGSSALELQPIALVTTSFFIDAAPAPGVVWYGVASTNAMGTSDPHNTETGRDGQACVTGSGSDVQVNARGCVSSGG